MLEAIARYADREGLTVRPGFTAKTVKWLLSLGADGRFTVQELGSGEAKNRGLELRSCPEFPANEMQSGGKAHPMVESLNVVALMGKSAGEPAGAKDEAKHAYFVQLLREVAESVPEARRFCDALADGTVLEDLRGQLFAAKAKSTDKATLGVGGAILVDDSRVADWWTVRRQGGGEPEEGTSLCLVTGQPTKPLATHPKIGGLGSVGGLAIGSSLISFDKGAFTSFGLDQSANAPVSEAAAMRYRAGINHLIQRGRRFGPMIVGAWYSGTVPEEDDPLAMLEEGDGEAERADAEIRARQLLEALHTGQRPELSNYRYYSLSLSGAAGRVMVRDWQEGQFADLVKAVDAWFRDLRLVAPRGNGYVRNPKFIAVAATTVRQLDDLAPPLVAALWKSAATGSQVPLAAVRGALNRTRIDILDDQIRPIRMGLLKAYLSRHPDYGIHMKPNLNPDHPCVAYQAGRLMAVLASIQYRALGNVNANVVQRFYPAASSTPALVFGRLTRQAQFHLAKIGPRRARSLELKLAEIWGRVQGGLPTTFSLEQQTLFALGYYQQVAQDAYEQEQRKRDGELSGNADLENDDTDENGETL